MGVSAAEETVVLVSERNRILSLHSFWLRLLSVCWYSRVFSSCHRFDACEDAKSNCATIRQKTQPILKCTFIPDQIMPPKAKAAKRVKPMPR